MVTLDDVRALATALPGAEEGTSYGTPAWKVKGKLFARLREEGDVLALKTDDKEGLLASDPGVFFTTPHYDGHPMVLVRMDVVAPGELRELLEDAWRLCAPKRLQAELG